MRDRLAIAAAIIALTFLSYFQFPGHTYLGSDTQIYVPMLEHIWEPSALIARSGSYQAASGIHAV